MRQRDLFSEPAALPRRVPDLVQQHDFLNLSEERALLDAIDASAWDNDFRRRVQVFGLGYGARVADVDAEVPQAQRALQNLRNRRTAAERYAQAPAAERAPEDGPRWLRDFPAWAEPLCARLLADGHFPRMPENVVVNDYAPGVGIAPHKDYPSFAAPIACVSLGSDIVLDFIESSSGEKVAVEVPARSLWVMHEEARWRWRHGIASRLSDVIGGERRRRARRVSITFRLSRRAISQR